VTFFSNASFSNSSGRSVAEPGCPKNGITKGGHAYIGNEVNTYAPPQFSRIYILFLIGSILTDLASLAIICRLAEAIVLTAPGAHLHISFASIIFLPAITFSLFGAILARRIGRLKTLSCLALAGCFAFCVLSVCLHSLPFSRAEALAFVAFLSALTSCSFVPRLAWLIDKRKLLFGKVYAPTALALAFLAAVWLGEQNISTNSLCQCALLCMGLASIIFRIAGKEDDSQFFLQKRQFARLIPVLARGVSITLGELIFFGCLIVTSSEATDNNFLLNFAQSFCTGITLGAFSASVLKLNYEASQFWRNVSGIFAYSLLILYGFSGQSIDAVAFVFVASLVYSVSIHLAPVLSMTLPSDSKSKNSSPNVEICVAAAQAVVLMIMWLVCVAISPITDTISSGAHVRLFALIGGVVSLLAGIANRAISSRHLHGLEWQSLNASQVASKKHLG
jgi:hypothetical protein